MRDTVEYPVTTQEKYDVVKKLLNKWVAENRMVCGDITGMVLQDVLNDMIRSDPTIKHDHFSQ